MPEVMVIAFAVLVTLGLMWRRSGVALVLLAGGIGFAAAVIAGKWSFLPAMLKTWGAFLYYSLLIMGYIILFIAPAVTGALAGHGLRKLRRRFCKHGRVDQTEL
jgi:hypothetical protein